MQAAPRERSLASKILAPVLVAPVVETAVLLAFGPHAAAPLGPQVTAPPPFDLFHDLRWIATYHNSWLSLGAELAAAIGLRSLYAAWIVGRLSRTPRPFWRTARLAFVAYATAAVLLAPWVALLFGLAITHLSYLFFVALPPALFVVFATHRSALNGRGWFRPPTRRTLAWTAAAFVWLTASGAAIASLPAPLALAAAGGVGWLNARAIEAITRPRDETAPSLMRRAVVPVTVVGAFAIVVAGCGIGFAVVKRPSRAGGSVAIPTHAPGRPVVFAAGFNSTWGPAPQFGLSQSYAVWRYSYRGISGGRLLPYSAADTHQSLFVSASRLALQVDALYAAYRRPVSIVAESEGALVARTYLLRSYRPATRHVERLIILDMPQGEPFVTFPPRGKRGWGIGTGWILRGVATILRKMGPSVSADAPLIRDLLDRPELMSLLALAPPPPGVQQTSIKSLADAVSEPFPHSFPNSVVVAAPHGGLAANPAVQRIIAALLEGRRLPHASATGRIERLVGAASSAWQVPSLELVDL